MSRFHKELERQLRFLSTSCEEFDRGNLDEGIRIATVLRVLLHNTRNSQSLFSHLQWRNIRLLSTSSHKGGDSLGTLTNVELRLLEGVKFVPRLGQSPGQFIPFSHWWEGEIVFERPMGKVFRKTLVLWAANKDGGAHVDAELPPVYQELLSGSWFTLSHERPGQFKHEMRGEDAPLAALRQIGFEVLNSNLLK